MPLDPSIPLGVRPAQVQSPFEAMTQIAQLQEARSLIEARRLAADKARQDAADQAAIRNVFEAAGGDPDKALVELYRLNPNAAAAFEERLGKARKEQAESAIKNLDLRKNRLTFGLQIAQQITDDATLEIGRPLIAAISPDAEKLLPPTYDKARMNTLIQAGLSAHDKVTADRESLKLYLEGKHHEAVSRTLGAINPADPQAAAQWDQGLAAAKALGVKPDVLAEFGAYTGPDSIARAAQLGISSEKRAELAGQEATRAQTAAHQQALEANAQAQLGISRGQLGVAQARERREAATPDLVQVMRDGKAVWVPKSQAAGQPAAGGAAGRPATGAERGALAFYNRGLQALDTLTTPDASGTSLEDRVSGATTQWLGNVPVVGNYLQGAEAQAYTQAQRAFTEARLRKESGAAINASEYENDRKTYFKQPGDSAAVVAQKRLARQKVLNGLAFSAGKAYEEYYGEPFTRETGTSTTTTTGPHIGERRLINGQLGEWDGKGWKAVR